MNLIKKVTLKSFRLVAFNRKGRGQRAFQGRDKSLPWNARTECTTVGRQGSKSPTLHLRFGGSLGCRGLKPRLYCTLQHGCLLPSAFFTLLLFLVISLAASPAIAAINTNSNKSFLQQFAETYASLKIYIKQFEAEFSQGWGELSNSVQQSIESSIGDLGMPDPIKSGRQINITIGNQKTNIATTDPGLQGNDAQHRWHQQYSLGQVESVLGKEGQQVQAQEADMTNNALSTSMDLGDAAQGDIVTQDILKKMAIQSAQENIIFKSMHGEAQKQTRSLAAVNINLTDISGRMDEQSRRQQFEDNASARQVIESAAFTDGFWEKTKR